MYRFQQVISGRSRRYWVLAIFLSIVMLFGGGGRSDIASLVVLRPLAVIACCYGLWSLTRDQVAHYRWLFVLAMATTALTALHLVPLPPALWQALPGRALIAEIDRAAGIAPIWRPLSVAPEATWNALFSLAVPIAVLLIGVQLSRTEQRGLLTVFVIFGLLSALMAVFQTIAPTNPMLYPYRITNDGLAVGLFANRNHAAIMMACLLPMLALYGSRGDEGRFPWRLWLAVSAGLAVLALIMVAGSRAGLVAAILALAAIPFVFSLTSAFPGTSRGRGRKPAWWPSARTLAVALGAVAALAVVGFAVFSSRALSLQRLVESGDGESRVYLWNAAYEGAKAALPFGTGIGSFVEAFKVIEPAANLSKSYANHAHNDWLEVLMTAGLPGLALLGAAFVAWALASWSAWRARPFGRSSARYARLGSILLLLLALASVGDYPLRVPSIMCLAVVAALWLRGSPPEPGAVAGDAAYAGGEGGSRRGVRENGE